MSKKNIEYEDAYVLEERPYIGGIDEILNDIELNDDLTMDSLELTEDAYENLTDNFDNFKAASEIAKKKMGDRNIKITPFSAKVVKREELVEDYIRNFLTKYYLSKSLDVFNVSFIFTLV
jgi:hypothetical protein